MFMSKDMFDDNSSPGSPSSPTEKIKRASSATSPPTAPYTSASSSSVSGSVNISTFDDSGQALTPAMRKAKMEELRQQQIGKRKGRILTPTVVSKQERPHTAQIHTHTGGSSSTHSQAFGSSSSTITLLTPKSSSSSQSINNSSNQMAYRSTTSLPTTRTSMLDMDNMGSSLGEDMRDQQPAAANRVLHPMEKDLLAQGIQPIYEPNTNNNNNNNNTQTHRNQASTAGTATSPVSTALSASPVSVATLSPLSLRLFLLSPCAPTHYHQCFITRNKKGLANRLYPSYECVYEQGEKLLMVARKRSKNKTSNYIISSDKDHLDPSDEEMLGKVRANFVGTEFSIYDQGCNPDKKSKGGEEGSAANREKRAELGVILYESNILGSRGPRKMTVIIPAVKQNKDGKLTAHVHRPQTGADSDTLLAAYKQQPSSLSFTALVNKTPKWNEQVGAYVLNFNGRVTMASVKNFQLIVHQSDRNHEEEDNGATSQGDNQEDERPCLQFGRVSKDTFTMDFGYPLTPVQAFAICLSSFDYKLACE